MAAMPWEFKSPRPHEKFRTPPQTRRRTVSQRDVTVLGCSSQVPTRHRNHNGYLLRWDGEGFLFDPGEGTQRQFIFAGVTPSTITRVFITHFHGDHCLGMAGMFQRLSLDQIPHTLHVYYPASGQEYLDRLRRASIYRDRLKVEYHPISEEGLVDTTDKFEIYAYSLDHPVPTFGYRIVEPDSERFDKKALQEYGLQGPLIGKLKASGTIERNGQTISLKDVTTPYRGACFAFVMDTRPCPGARKVAQDADLLVCESTFLDSEEKIAHEYFHMTVGQAATLAKEAQVGTLMLAHFSQRYRKLEEFRIAAEKIFPRVVVSKDLLQVPFTRKEQLTP